MTPKDLYALVLLEILNVGFGSSISVNPNIKLLTNSKGNSVWVTMLENEVEVKAFRVTTMCMRVKLGNRSDLVILSQ
jgi:hypothetical protein